MAKKEQLTKEQRQRIKRQFDEISLNSKAKEELIRTVEAMKSPSELDYYQDLTQYLQDKNKTVSSEEKAFKELIDKYAQGIPEVSKRKQLENRYDEDYIFRHDGATWTVKYNGLTKTIKHTKGMDYIEFLLRHQEQKIHSMKLYQMMSGIVPDVDKRMSKTSPERIEADEGLHVDGKDAFELVDQKDIDSVKNTIKQLEDEHPQAMMENDSVRENEISIKLDKLNDYLSKCTYKGKIRTASDATERMRVSIYMAIKTAKNNIKKHHKELFNHLNKFITTGTSISYSPDSPVSWFQDR